VESHHPLAIHDDPSGYLRTAPHIQNKGQTLSPIQYYDTMNTFRKLDNHFGGQFAICLLCIHEDELVVMLGSFVVGRTRMGVWVCMFECVVRGGKPFTSTSVYADVSEGFP